jgi:FkbM family methyltransferase
MDSGRRKIDILQIGAHVGNTCNDPIFNKNEIENYNDIILIEPVPYLFKQLKNNYSTKKNFDKITFLNIAASNKNGSIDLYIPSEKNDFSKFGFWANQLASVNQDHIKIHIPECIVDKITVETKTLNTLIEEFNIESIENLFIDTEGHDYEILMDLDLTKLKPKNIWFENKHMDGVKFAFDKNNCPRYNELMKHFKENGYEMVFERTEDTYIKLNTL